MQYWIMIGEQLINNLRITIDSRRVTNITYFTLEIMLFKDLQDLTEGNKVTIKHLASASPTFAF